MLTSDKEGVVMKRFPSIIALALGAISMMGLVSGYVFAADYPVKPISIICPSATGGSTDLLARIFASVAEKYLGQPAVVVNKPGAAGMVGSQEGANANPDGYTLTLDSSGMTSIIEWEIANGRKPLVTRDDFVPIGSWTKSPTVVLVPSKSPWNTLADLTKDLKAKPNQYAFCSAGYVSPTHVCVELLLNAIGTKARHVPHQGGGPCVIALTGGHIDFACQFPSSSISLIQGNKLRGLAVLSDKRLKALPEIPTCKELGVDVQYYMYNGLLAPQKTPMPIVQKLREVTKKVVEDPSFIERVEKAGEEVRPMIGDDLTQYVKYEMDMYAKLSKQLVKEKQ
jgi:tripartite-type tricarboxylate transporter receptor subunit TctC